MLSLASRCIFYRPEHKANRGPLKWNFEVLEMQRRDKQTGRAQQVDEKNGVKVFKKWLKSYLLPELWLLKCKTWIFVFSADDSKN